MDTITVSRTNFSPNTILTTILNSSFVSKIASLVLLVVYFCSFSTTIFDHLCAIPGYVLPPNLWIWTLITHSFVQPHVVLLIVDISVILLSGKLLEPLWGLLHIGIFFLITSASSAFLTSFVYMIVYYVTGNTDYLFETRIYGMAAYSGGFCTAIKQLMPDQILLTLPFGRIRNKHIPIIFLCLAICLSLGNVLNGPYPFHIGFGILISWIYLRFYQRHDNGNKGDMAEEFSFASFFPPPLELPVAILSNTIFSLLIRMKVCKKPQRKYDVSSPATITVTLPGTDPADAERRRQLAIKALNERLSKSTEEYSWPGLEDDNDEDEFGKQNSNLAEVVISDAKASVQTTASKPGPTGLPSQQSHASHSTSHN